MGNCKNTIPLGISSLTCSHFQVTPSRCHFCVPGCFWWPVTASQPSSCHPTWPYGGERSRRITLICLKLLMCWGASKNKMRNNRRPCILPIVRIPSLETPVWIFMLRDELYPVAAGFFIISFVMNALVLGWQWKTRGRCENFTKPRLSWSVSFRLISINHSAKSWSITVLVR